MTMLLWATAWMAVDSMMLIATWKERVWILSWTMTFSKAIWDYDSVAKWMQELIEKTWWTSTEAALKIRNDLVSLHTQTRITNIYLEAWEDTWKFINEIKALAANEWYKWQINSEMIDDLVRKMPDSTKWLSTYQKVIAKSVWDHSILSATSIKSLMWKMERFVKGWFADAWLWGEDVIKRSNLVRGTLSEAVINRWSLLETMTRLKNCFKIAPLPWTVNNSMMAVHIENVEEFNKVISYSWLQAKNLVAWLFRNLPIVIVWYNAMALWTTAWDKAKSALYWLATLIPFAWPILVMRHWTKLEDWSMPNTCDLFLGWALFTFDTVQLIKLISTKWLNAAALAEFAARPALMIKDLAWGVLKTWYGLCRLWGWAYEAWKAWTLAEAVAPFATKTLAWAVLVWTAAVIWYYLYNWEVPPDKIVAKLKEDGFIDANWNVVEAKLKSSYNKLSKEQKEMISTIVVESCINWPIHTTNALVAWSGNQLKTKEFQVQMKNDVAIVYFESLSQVQDRENVAKVFSQLWMAVDFRYTESAMKDYARTFKEKWKSKEEFVQNMKLLWITWNIEKYYS